ncbi:pseudouridine synthase [Buchnera aphidicola (Nipponaphis monzeni)]|uniref:Pseudouridine synthase n=1 Tax=Buchnera aphidicola (Nipponaphis monzeni) TaxID=2495405 RepID=A0A455TA77_9GAMM|nr:pseudouridine synthase [Buchnera aphidicola]BBI01233.1 pseudouridine synthase [Buchnera aphidicola (Nipponaphis monzeni)]
MTEKVQKILSNIGYASRRKIEEMIALGWVKINNIKINIGQRIDTRIIHTITIKEKNVFFIKKKICRTLIYNKPLGEICTRKDPKNRNTVFDNLPKIKNCRWISVGRLDINTKGLLLFTTNGNFANNLMHPKFNIFREYLVRVFGKVNIHHIQYLNNRKKQINNLYTKFQNIIFYKKNNSNTWFRVSLTEGKKNEIRNLFKSLNLQVNQLIRIRYGNFHLPRNLLPGQFIELK